MDDFQQKNDRQFDAVDRALTRLGQFYIIEIADYFLERTPGFGNQYDGTQYIPTGRLRGGLDWTRSPIRVTSKGYEAARREAGPFSDYGRETLERIRGQVSSVRVDGISYLENDVAYADDIVRGAHNHSHIGPRNFPADAAVSTAQLAAYRRALAQL